jgi:hypothetical protein
LLVARLKEKESNTWQTLPWLHRAMPRVGLKVLFQAARIHNAESMDSYRRLQVVERRQMIALVIGACAIVIVLSGTRYWGWNW